MNTFLSLIGLVGFFLVFSIALGAAAGIVYLIASRVSERDRAQAARRAEEARAAAEEAGHPTGQENPAHA